MKYPKREGEFTGDWALNQFIALNYDSNANNMTVAWGRNQDGTITKRIGVDEAAPLFTKTAPVSFSNA